MILSEQQLVDTLHEHCEKAKFRIWIASPFIGSLKEFLQILGGNWMRANIDFRILTDVDAGFIREDTFKEVNASTNSQIKTLLSLHAKIYIIDDWCMLSSANLTGTAFSRRYEIGCECTNINDVESLYLKWWNLATLVSSIDNKKIHNEIIDYQDGKSFSKKCKLPRYTTHKTDKFLVKCDKFIEFAKYYERTTGRNKQMISDGFTLYQEVDYFFNYLYHIAPNKPSNSYKNKPARNLSDKQKRKEVLKYFKQMPYDKTSEHFRIERSTFIQESLNSKNINSLTMKDIKEILECFHCLSSYPINRTRIVNNNKINDIKKAWDTLLNTGTINSEKIEDVKKSINFFGDSCASELIAWYMPDKYPMMNLNSESGMRFFGIQI